MKQLLTLILLIAFAFPVSAQEETPTNQTSTYYFIRHAEKDKSDKTNRNPNLIMEGVLRAAKWMQRCATGALAVVSALPVKQCN